MSLLTGAGYLPSMHVPNLRSPYDQVGGIRYIGRMFDKIRLHAAGHLPEDYHANLGKGFDARAGYSLVDGVGTVNGWYLAYELAGKTPPK